MEETDKDKGSAVHNPHNFPVIHPDSEKTDGSADGFRPLYQLSTGGLNAPKNCGCDGAEQGNGNDALAVALKKKFERGVEAGNKEACGLALKELEPSLNSFFDSLNAYADSFRQLTHGYAAHIVSLAQAISGKIVEGCTIKSSDELSPIQQDLSALLERFHQLCLDLHSDDLKELADLMQCRGIAMNDIGAVQICDNNAVQRGAPQRRDPATSFEGLRENIAQTIAELQKAST